MNVRRRRRRQRREIELWRAGFDWLGYLGLLSWLLFNKLAADCGDRFDWTLNEKNNQNFSPDYPAANLNILHN